MGSNEKFDWIVFDLGGVVIDVDFNRFFSALPKHCVASAQAHAKQIVTLFTDYEAQSGAVAPEAVFDAFRNLIGEDVSDAQIIYAVNAVLGKERPHVCEQIRQLQKTHKLACLSNTNHIHWEYLLNNYPIMQCFAVKMASHLMGVSKPDVEIFRRADRLLMHGKGKMLFIDDKVENVVSARNHGWVAWVGAEDVNVSLLLESLKVQAEMG